MRIPIGMWVVCVAAFYGSAHAEEPKGKLPAPENAQLVFFVGTWACEGQVHKTDVGSREHSFTSLVESKLILRGRWLASDTVEQTTGSEPGHTLDGHAIRGWDVATSSSSRAA